MISIITETRLSNLIDIVIVAALLWFGLSWLRNTRARLALPGILIIGGLFFVAQLLRLQLTIWIFQGFFAVFVLVIVIVFQEDIHRLFERLSVWSLRRPAPIPRRAMTDIIVQAVTHLTEGNIGALIVLPGREPLERHLEGGIPLNGEVSGSLLLSIFDSSSPGHDGAVVFRGDKIAFFGAHLPLSTDWDRIGLRGTRHAAALGLAERSDALCIVVSEERGTISVAKRGELFSIEHPEALYPELNSFIQKSSLPPHARGLRAFFRRVLSKWREGVISFGLAAAIWFVFVPGNMMTEMVEHIPVIVENLPEEYILLEVDPPEVEVAFKGPRRDLFLVNSGQFNIHLDADFVKLGRRTFKISSALIEHPESLKVVNVHPAKVRLDVKKK